MLNEENFVTRHIKILSMLIHLNDVGLVAELQKTYNSIMSIILYGSIARGDYDHKSDIDILIIANKTLKFAQHKFEKRLSREINFIVYTYTDWKKKAKEDKVFYDKVIRDGIALYGDIPMVI